MIIEKGLDVARLEEVCQAELERWGAPGVEVVAVKDGEVVYTGGFGRRRLDPDQPVTADTVFAHGSTGKAFTAFLVGTLVDAGELAWDKPVREYLPELRLSDSTVADRVTLRDLLSHRSGLPRHDLAWIANPSVSRPELVVRLRYLELSKDLRQTLQYSNLGFILAGRVVEVVTGSTYEDQLQERIFEPLGMQRTYTRTADVLAQEDRAEPYLVRDGKAVAIPRRGIDNACPAGGIVSCARDTARWLLVQLQGGEIDGRRLLSEAAFKETHTLQMPFAAPQNDEEFAVTGYGLGWCTGTYRGRRMIWHNGGIDGFYTEFLLLPDDGIAVGTCNNASERISTSVARHLADQLLGLEPKDWGALLKEQNAKAEASAADAKPKAVEGTSASHPLEDFAAVYSHPGYGDLAFEVRDGELAARIGEIALDAKRRHYDTWDLTLAGLSDMSASASFYTDPTGAVTDVFLPIEPTLEPIRFRRKAGAELSDPEFLARLAGVYESGPIRVEISVSPSGRLLANQAGQQAELEPAGKLAFALSGMPSVQLQFELDENGKARQISTQGVALTRVD